MKREKNRGLQRALQVRFVLLATLSAALLVGSIVGIVLLRSYGQFVKKADHLLELIQTSPNSPEIGDAHYFSVLVSYGTRTVSADLSHTSFVREWTAVSMGRQVLKNGKVRGFLEGYRFCVMKSAEGAEILFLSRRLPLETFRNTEKLLIWVSILGILGTAAILALLSGRIVAPLVEANERQKRFVTSASHGLKTPVAVILGDTQLLQMEMPENEWLNDIEKQAKRLTEMTQSLVTLARWDEGGQPGSRIAFPISDVAEDIAASFRAIAENRGLPFQVRIARNLSYCGDDDRSAGQRVPVLSGRWLRGLCAGKALQGCSAYRAQYRGQCKKRGAAPFYGAFLPGKHRRKYPGFRPGAGDCSVHCPAAPWKADG